MKIAISSTGKNLADNISEMFARSPYFIIVEIENGKIQKTEAVENKNANQLGRAGISVSQLMAEKSIEAVITKNMGPRAFDVLKQFNIEVYSGSGAIKESLQKFIERKLEKIKE